MKVKVSIIMPVYNGEVFLNESIKSVLNQSFLDYELICVDDGSTDKSVEIIEYYANIDSRVIFFKKDNGGPGSALNYGVEKARGEFLCFIDQDDKYHFDYISKMYNAIVFDNLDIVICNAFLWDGENILKIPYSQFPEKIVMTNSKSVLKVFRNHYYPQWTKIVRKSVFIKNKIFFPNIMNKAHDIPVHYLLISQIKEIGYIKECLYYHRFHLNQLSNSSEPISNKIRSLVNMLEWKKNGNKTYNKLIFRYFSKHLAKSAIREARDLKYFNELKCIISDRANFSIVDRLYLLCYLINKKTKLRKRDSVLKLKIPNCIVGKNSYCADDIKIASGNTTIGNFCSIGANVQLGNGEHPLNYLSTSPYFYFDSIGWKKDSVVSHNEYWNYKGVKIYNDVWIGDNVVVMNGVKIGNGAVIGMNSVVTKDVPPFAIVAGVPAKIIRYRFDKDIIEKLEKLKWWHMSEDILKDCPYDNINKAIEFLESRSKL